MSVPEKLKPLRKAGEVLRRNVVLNSCPVCGRAAVAIGRAYTEKADFWYPVFIHIKPDGKSVWCHHTEEKHYGKG